MVSDVNLQPYTAAPVFFDRGIAKPATREISSLSMERCDGEELLATLFEIPESEFPALVGRGIIRIDCVCVVYPETWVVGRAINPD